MHAETVVLTVYEGSSLDGSEYRSWAGVYTGKLGSSILFIKGSKGSWDEPAFN